MPTTLDENRDALQDTKDAHTQVIALQAPGNIVFAGNLWPDPTTGIGKQINSEVTEALTEARALVDHGLRKVKAARRGDQESVALMTKWFGPPTVPGRDDWWQGVDHILTALDQALLRDISVYYRGAEVMGRPNDYPAGTPGSGTPLDARDVSGYAETFGGANDLRIGLCGVFFRRDQYKARSIRRKGFDSIGGVLVHEMSHNLCATKDHTNATGRAYYGTVACQALPTQNLAREAWYNADNIEYVCEETYYGIIPTQPPMSRLVVSALAGEHQQAQSDAAQTRASTTPVTTGVSVNDLAQSHERAQQDAAQTQTSDPVETGVDVKALREKFK